MPEDGPAHRLQLNTAAQQILNQTRFPQFAAKLRIESIADSFPFRGKVNQRIRGQFIVLERSRRRRPDLAQVIAKFDEMFPDARDAPLPVIEPPVLNEKVPGTDQSEP
jgi:hypothetical protein